MSTVSISAARAALPEIVDRVIAGEEVTLTRHGEAVAVMVRPDALRLRRADAALAAAQDVHDLLQRSRRTPLVATSGLTQERADALAAEVRAARKSR